MLSSRKCKKQNFPVVFTQKKIIFGLILVYKKFHQDWSDLQIILQRKENEYLSFDRLLWNRRCSVNVSRLGCYSEKKVQILSALFRCFSVEIVKWVALILCNKNCTKETVNCNANTCRFFLVQSIGLSATNNVGPGNNVKGSFVCFLCFAPAASYGPHVSLNLVVRWLFGVSILMRPCKICTDFRLWIILGRIPICFLVSFFRPTGCLQNESMVHPKLSIQMEFI